MHVMDEFRAKVKSLLEEAPGFYLSKPEPEDEPMQYLEVDEVSERIANIAEVLFDAPEGLVEVRCYLEKVTFNRGKDVSLTLTCLNTPENKKRLASIEDAGVIVRGLQYEMKLDQPGPEDEAPAGGAEEPDEDPNQTRLEDFDTNGEESVEEEAGEPVGAAAE